MTAMKINPPFGYAEIIVLNKTQRVVLPKPGEAPAFCRTINAMPLSYTEFARASHDYPVVFISGDEGKTYGTVAVLGLEAGQNLFVGQGDQSGAWDKTTYVPAYVRRYPFCMAKINVDKVARSERVVCVEQQAIDEKKGQALFNDKGEALPLWDELEKLLREYEADLMRSEEMCAILKEYDLLEPFSMQAALNSGGAMNLTGMHRVNEAKLENLKLDQYRNLVKKGVMGRIYAHLISLENFSRLLDRNVAVKPKKAA